MATIVSYQVTDEPILVTGTANVTDMTFRQLRALTQSPTRQGVETNTDMRVTDGGAGIVTVAAGFGWVDGTVLTGPSGQFRYGVPFPAAKNLTGIPSPASATRRDLIVCRVYDEGDAPGNGGLNEGRIQYIANAVESLTPEALPANAMLLAYCDVTTGGVKTITDKRQWSHGAALVSALPANPVDGQEILFQNAAMLTDGIVWRLRYNAASASAYKWEVLDAQEWVKETVVAPTTASATFVALTGAPSLTIPLAGDYRVKTQGRLTSNTATATVYLTPSGAGITAGSAKGIAFNCATATAAYDTGVDDLLTLTAAGTLTQQGATSGGTATFSQPTMTLTPVRVG